MTSSIRAPGPLHSILAILGAALLAGCSGREEAAANSIDPDSILALQLDAIGYSDLAEPEDEERLSRRGVVRFDRARAAHGWNILLSTRDFPFVELLDMDGNVVHRWNIAPADEKADDGRKKRKKNRTKSMAWREVDILPNGDLIGIDTKRAVERVDWNSKVLWRTPLKAHHDTALSLDGERLYALTKESRKLNLGPEEHIRIIDNDIVILDVNDGKILESIPLSGFVGDQLREKQIARIIEEDGKKHEWRGPRDVFHTNRIEILPRDVPDLGRRGNALVSVRNLNLVAVLDLETREVVWSWGPGVVSRQHHPTLLPNDHLLIVDNRPAQKNSRVIELDPATEEIVWEYEGDPPSSFETQSRGSSYLMPNGNVLIGESNHGRAIEVTRSGEIVWEFLHPRVKKKNQQRQAFYRFERLPLDFFDDGLLPSPSSDVASAPGTH